MLRWLRPAAVASARNAHVRHGAAHLACLNVAEGLFEVVDIAGGFTNLRINARADGRVVSRRRHLAGSVDDGIFAVDFADELLHGGIVVVAHVERCCGGARGGAGGGG